MCLYKLHTVVVINFHIYSHNGPTFLHNVLDYNKGGAITVSHL